MGSTMAETTRDRVLGQGGRVCGTILAFLLSACTSARSFVAPADDYSAYRATRVAATPELQLAAAAHYVKRYPEGMFTPDVLAYFARTEPVFYAARQDTEAGLSAYLNALPHGPHAEEALERLRTLAAKRTRPDAMAQAAARAGAQLDRQAAERLAVREQISLWLDRFLDVAVWRRPLSEAPADLIVPWALGLPKPSCSPEPAAGGLAASNAPGELVRCSKRLELPYSVFINARPDPRQATMDLALVLDPAGQVREMALSGPDLFARIEETYAARPIAPDDAASRINAISRMVDLVRREFAKKVSEDASCKRRVVAPVILDLACGGLRIVVTAGLDASEADRVILTRFEG
jgi:hypothetical protein